VRRREIVVASRSLLRGYDRLLAMMDEAGVDRAIIVPPSWEGDRNDYALEAARTYRKRSAVMGRIPLRSAKLLIYFNKLASG
jgi:predicted TIM-barrel fold metal-dependent hydrolase